MELSLLCTSNDNVYLFPVLTPVETTAPPPNSSPSFGIDEDCPPEDSEFSVLEQLGNEYGVWSIKY